MEILIIFLFLKNNHIDSCLSQAYLSTVGQLRDKMLSSSVYSNKVLELGWNLENCECYSQLAQTPSLSRLFLFHFHCPVSNEKSRKHFLFLPSLTCLLRQECEEKLLIPCIFLSTFLFDSEGEGRNCLFLITSLSLLTKFARFSSSFHKHQTSVYVPWSWWSDLCQAQTNWALLQGKASSRSWDICLCGLGVGLDDL